MSDSFCRNCGTPAGGQRKRCAMCNPPNDAAPILAAIGARRTARAAWLIASVIACIGVLGVARWTTSSDAAPVDPGSTDAKASPIPTPLSLAPPPAGIGAFQAPPQPQEANNEPPVYVTPQPPAPRPERERAVRPRRAEPPVTARRCAYCKDTRRVTCDACHGMWQSQESLACAACAGASRIVCKSCGGDGKQACAKCAGSGRVRETLSSGRRRVSDCAVCVGGQLSCRACAGAGLLRCAKCSGSGRLQQKTVCKFCTQGKQVCPRCD